MVGSTIYVKGGASLSTNGAEMTVYHEPGANLSVNGATSTVVECAALTYDLTDAPSPGCI